VRAGRSEQAAGSSQGVYAQAQPSQKPWLTRTAWVGLDSTPARRWLEAGEGPVEAWSPACASNSGSRPNPAARAARAARATKGANGEAIP